MQRSTKVSALLASLHEMKRSEPGAKAVVFTQFAKTHKETVVALKAEGFGVVEIRGNMTQKARSKSLEAFITDPKINVFALSLRSGAVGLTLTAASRCFLMEPCVNEGTELQAVNRIHRMGQTKKVKIVTFVAKNTAEERLMQLRRERVEAANAAATAAGGGASAAAGSTVLVVPGQTGAAAAAGGAGSMAEMQRFQAANAKIEAKLEEWQLMFGVRKATQEMDLGDPDPEAAAVADIIKNGLPKQPDAPVVLALEDRSRDAPMKRKSGPRVTYTEGDADDEVEQAAAVPKKKVKREGALDSAASTYTSVNNETPKQIADQLGILVTELISLNADAFPGIKWTSKLMDATVLPADSTIAGGVAQAAGNQDEVAEEAEEDFEVRFRCSCLSAVQTCGCCGR